MVSSKNHTSPNGTIHCFDFIFFMEIITKAVSSTMPIVVNVLSNKGSVVRLIGMNILAIVIGIVGRLLNSGAIPNIKSGGVPFTTLLLKDKKTKVLILQKIMQGKMRFQSLLFCTMRKYKRKISGNNNAVSFVNAAIINNAQCVI